MEWSDSRGSVENDIMELRVTHNCGRHWVIYGVVYPFRLFVMKFLLLTLLLTLATHQMKLHQKITWI